MWYYALVEFLMVYSLTDYLQCPGDYFIMTNLWRCKRVSHKIAWHVQGSHLLVSLFKCLECATLTIIFITLYHRKLMPRNWYIPFYSKHLLRNIHPFFHPRWKLNTTYIYIYIFNRLSGGTVYTGPKTFKTAPVDVLVPSAGTMII